MTLAGRILVVLNLFLGVLFLSMAVMVYATHLDLNADLAARRSAVSALEQQRGELEKKVGDFEQKLKEEQTRLKKLTEENTNQQNVQQTEIEDLTAKWNEGRAGFAKQTEQLARLHGTQVATREEVRKLEKQRKDQLDQLAKLEAVEKGLDNDLAQATNELRSIREREQVLSAQLAHLAETGAKE